MYETDFLPRDRVRAKTAPRVQAAIDERTRNHIRSYAAQPRPRLAARVASLEREWDVERVLELNASILALTGTVLGATVNKRFFLLTGLVLGFLAQHAISGWCPPLPVLRRLGVRTRAELNQEKYALKALRGDFAAVEPAPAPEESGAVRRAIAAVGL